MAISGSRTRGCPRPFRVVLTAAAFAVVKTTPLVLNKVAMEPMKDSSNVTRLPAPKTSQCASRRTQFEAKAALWERSRQQLIRLSARGRFLPAGGTFCRSVHGNTFDFAVRD